VSEPESARPAGCRFWLASDVIRWIEERVDYVALGHDSAKRAAMWWLAQFAVDWIHDMNSRERMEMVVYGLPPITKEDLDDHLQAPWLNNDVDTDIDADVEEDLTRFWNVK
jgi:hypothetical protein